MEVEDKFTVKDGTWFHACWTWSTGDYTTRVYLNSEMIGSVETTHRELKRGGLACIGNYATKTKYPNHIFGGDLYKFNIYKRVLEQTEIRILAADMCSVEELRLAASIILTWDDVLKNERAGNVTEIVLADCDYNKRFQLIWKDLERTNKDLTEGLEEITRNQKNTEEKLNGTQKDLERTNKDLTVRLDDMMANLKKNESKFILCGCFT
jgi:hypothetical protein